jgi:hypothetical protein
MLVGGAVVERSHVAVGRVVGRGGTREADLVGLGVYSGLIDSASR